MGRATAPTSMGLFSSKKKTYVSSVAYNLSGDEEPIDFLKYTTLQAVLQRRNISESITRGYLTGQGIKLRQAYSYAVNHYQDEMPVTQLAMIDSPNLSFLMAVLGSQHAGAVIEPITTYIGTADFTWWVEAYLASTYGYDRVAKKFLRPPEGVEPTALISYDMDSNGVVSAILTNANGDTKVITYRLPSISTRDIYVHSTYRTRATFGPDVTTQERPQQPGDQAGTRTTEQTVDRSGASHQIRTTTTTAISEGITHITTSVTTEVLSHPKYFFYQIGTGKYPELDQNYSAGTLSSSFYPSIPMRVDNVDFTAEARRKTKLFTTSEKYLKKVGIDILEIADSINDNEQINEIDYAFIVFGVELGVKTEAGKEYLWNFFQFLRNITVFNRTDFENWENGDRRGNPKTNTLKIRHPRLPKDRHNIELQWQYVDTRVVNGKINPNAKVNDVTIEAGDNKSFSFRGMDILLDVSALVVRKQINESAYEELVIAGLTYENHVYNGHSVILTAMDAMNDPEENGFILPLNQQVLNSMPLRVTTQLGYECVHVVFNCYQIVKKKWYQRGWFKVLIVIVAIVITAVTWGADGGSSLAAAMSWKAAVAMGVSSALVAYVAATIYVLGALVISTIIAAGATELFGEEWGAVIAALATMVVMNWGAAGKTAGAASSTTKSTLTASQIIQNTVSVVSKSYEGYLRGEFSEIQEESSLMQKEYETEMERIQALYKELLSPGTELIDIEGFIDATQNFHAETPGVFFGRTLMTGSDIVQMTHGLIENFVDIGLDLRLN